MKFKKIKTSTVSHRLKFLAVDSPFSVADLSASALILQNLYAILYPTSQSATLAV